MSATMNSRVAVVTVTYGVRSHLAIGTLRRALDVGAAQVVVVMNGSGPNEIAAIQAETSNHRPGRVIVHVVAENLGSAGGFNEGMAIARDLPGVEYVWLLDDDNRPDEGALVIALEKQHALELKHGADHVATVCARDYLAPHRRIREGVPVRYVYSRPGAALGFDIRTRALRDRVVPTPPESSVPVEVPLAPYGGLLLRRDHLTRVGLPRADFVLYDDDYEYTDRLRAHGVRTFLLLDAHVDDVESPVRGGPGPRELVRLLRAPKAVHSRIYYQLRNDLILDRQRARSVAARGMVVLNLAIYLTAVAAFALRSKQNRVAVPTILTAVRDGWCGRLGRTVPLTLL